MKKTVFYLVLFTILLVQSVSAHEFVATIIKIHDGDTLTALVNNENTKIRLLDVDCYETGKNSNTKFQQKYYGLSVDEVLEKGKQSRKILKKQINKIVSCVKNCSTGTIFFPRRDLFRSLVLASINN
ncbi:MAG: hypothetical protein IJ852_03700 [Alphaproteobacteria bacterium]|nr:hypothetical protein [Alphaproteobacteria bacterium]